MFVITVLI